MAAFEETRECHDCKESAPCRLHAIDDPCKLLQKVTGTLAKLYNEKKELEKFYRESQEYNEGIVQQNFELLTENEQLKQDLDQEKDKLVEQNIGLLQETKYLREIIDRLEKNNHDLRVQVCRLQKKPI